MEKRKHFKNHGFKAFLTRRHHAKKIESELMRSLEWECLLKVAMSLSATALMRKQVPGNEKGWC